MSTIHAMGQFFDNKLKSQVFCLDSRRIMWYFLPASCYFGYFLVILAMSLTRSSRLTHRVKSVASTMEALGQSESFLAFQEQLSRVAAVDRPVLLLGERGTGKELAATRLHYLSMRWQGPLVTLNCAALTPSLIESELFGYEKGAFTGAQERKKGRFEVASRGTLFLDEVGSIPLQAQEKILAYWKAMELIDMPHRSSDTMMSLQCTKTFNCSQRHTSPSKFTTLVNRYLQASPGKPIVAYKQHFSLSGYLHSFAT
jgi:hypothetical protein